MQREENMIKIGRCPKRKVKLPVRPITQVSNERRRDEIIDGKSSNGYEREKTLHRLSLRWFSCSSQSPGDEKMILWIDHVEPSCLVAAVTWSVREQNMIR